MTSVIAKKKEYVKKDPREHVLLRPDMYVGSNKSRKTTEFVCIKNSDGLFQIVKKEIDVSPAILRIFIEILSNATDNVERSKNAGIPCSYIKVNINKETGEITVVNDGDVIPIEMNNEEKMYNHTLIFGNLLTGSNYDDEEERLISGRNGLGSKCCALGTKVPCFDGSIKNVEDIKVGEYLIGDDGKKRKVLNKIHGFGEMYEVSQSRGDPYVVNSEHILSLRMPDHKVIYWSTEKQGWQMVYLDSKNKKIHCKSVRALKSPDIECFECGINLIEGSLKRHYRRVHKDKQIPERNRKGPTINPPNDCEEVRNAYIEMEKFAKTITDDNTIDISIKDYLKSNATFKSRLTGYKSECVQWERKEVLLDPYILGLWLGDGSQHGYGIAINSEDDYEILNYVKEWGKNNDANFRNKPRCENCKVNKHDPNFIPCRHCVSYSVSSVENYRKKNKSPLKNLLQKYGLLEEKFIPDEYKINDRDTRLKVLAGLIDSDGHVSKEREGRRICISQGMMHERLADDIMYLARSLGFSASKITRDVKWIYKDEIRKGQCVSINISGNGLEDIPTLLPRKKCFSPLSREVLNNGPIKIKKVDDGKFVGLEIDGNERFVINDFTVTHNCTNVFSSKFTVKGLDPNQKKTFEQTWTENMKNASIPIIEKTKLTKGYTSVSYIADFKQFGLKGYTDDIISIYLKYVIDVAMLSKVKVYFNDELIPVNNLQTYSKLYESVSDENLLIKHENSEVLITPSSPSEFQVVSFVNGIYTKLGGQHVDAWSEAIFRPLVEKFNKKGQPTLNIKDIKQFFRIFVVSYVINPEFESQNKHKLENPKVNVSFKTADLNKILKWSVMEDIEDIIKSKEILTLKKSEKKKKGYVKIEGLDPANYAGTKESHLCSLILCEGLSAKTYAVAGIEKGVNGVSGRNYYGVLALKGKCLALDTPILLWNGTVKKAKDVLVGDILINDEGEPTTVNELFRGTDNMYEIQQFKGDNFTVNSEHTLTLKIVNHCSIVWSEGKKRWKLIYFDKNDMKMKSRYVACEKNDNDIEEVEKKENKCEEICCNEKIYSSRSNLTRHYKDFHPSVKIPSPSKRIPHNKSVISKEQGYIKINEYMKEIECKNNVFDISIKDYLKLDNETKNLLMSFKLNNYIKWDKKEVEIDPYILGMWLGDGLQTGYGFAGEDIELINEWYKWCLKNDGEIVHNNRDSFTIRKKNCCKRGGDFKKKPIGTKQTSIKACRACKVKMTLACANDEELKAMGKERVIEIVDYENKPIYGNNPLVTALSKYNLINNKHIPIDYIINDKETRLKLLAGLIDTDGHVLDGRIEICQSAKHKNILDSLMYICRSLGFYCKLSEKKAFYTDKNGNKINKEAYRLSISGNGLQEIPTKLQRKKLNHVFVKDSRNTSFNIVEKGVGEYVGFQTDKTHRFLLGDFTVTHNCLNVRNSSMESISKNKVITDLIQALNLQHGVDYTDENNFKNLSYGKVILLTDADVDGKHISSLIMNLFHYLFPSILKRKEPYLVSMETPIVRVFRKEGDLLFYDEKKFHEFSKNQTSKIKCKYYKGLGTTKSEDVKDTFGEKMIEYIKDDECDTSFNKVFHNKFSDQRKEWLEKYDPTSFSTVESDKFSSMNITDFLNNEMIKFSHDDCKRSIPNLFDGLKQSQRKVLYAMKKRNLTYNKASLKVAQLAGYVAEVSNYHHGEGNLFQTITKMANEFAGSNNIPLLYRDGQFGSRSNNGADAANARYIFTKMEPLTPLIFREEDDVLLERVYDDGDEVEPTFYIPIIPMVLVNGASGIGSGWSSSIPSYNPLDIINCIEIWLKRDGKIIDREGDTIVSHLPEITPWYRDFKGEITKTKEKNDTTYITHGVIEKDKNKAIITEIPIGMSTDKFKEMCEDWMVDKKIKNFQNYSTPNGIYFVITESEDGFSCNLKNMKLHSYVYTSNMVLFNEKEQLKKYSIEEIINDFCVVRYDFYKKRKAHLLSIIRKDLRHLFNKARFVEEVIAKKLHIMNVDEEKIVESLEKAGYDKENEKVNDDEESGSTGGYNYLLKMQVRTFTSNKVRQLRSEIEEKNNRLKNIESTSEKQLWLNDLDEFKKEYVKWLKIMEPKPLTINKQQKKKKKETA